MIFPTENDPATVALAKARFVYPAQSAAVLWYIIGCGATMAFYEVDPD